jgi:hypothetical protein
MCVIALHGVHILVPRHVLCRLSQLFFFFCMGGGTRKHILSVHFFLAVQIPFLWSDAVVSAHHGQPEWSTRR